MKINITAVGTDLTESLRSYVEKKLTQVGKIVDATDEEAIAQVDIGKTTKHHVSGTIFKAEIILRAYGKKFTVTAEKEDMYAAIDAVKDEIEEQVTSFRDKKKDMERKGGRELKKMIHTGE